MNSTAKRGIPYDEERMASQMPVPRRDDAKLEQLNWQAIKRFLGLAHAYRQVFILASVMTLVSSGLNLSLPLVAQTYFPRIVSSKQVSSLDRVALFIGGILLVAATIQFVQWVITVRAGNAVVTDLRARVFHHLQRLPVSYFDRTKANELTTRLSNDVTQIQQVLTLDVVNVIANVVTLTGGVLIAFYIDWKLSLSVIVLIGLMSLVIIYAGKRLRRLNRLTLDALSETMGGIGEALANIRIVKAFARQVHEDHRAGRHLSRVLKLSDRTAVWEAAIGVTAMVGFLLLTVAVIWWGGRRVLTGDLETKNFIAFFFAVTILGSPMSMLASLYSRLQKAVGASDRIFEILDETREPIDPPDSVAFPEDGQTNVEVRDLTFGYDPERPVLKSMNLRLPPGKVTALVGQSGSGKTTLASLIFRFYEPQGGEITIDGIPITKIQRNNLREHIGIVPQMPVLFNVSIRENIRYGRLDATDEEIEAAARDANITEFVEKLPFGFNTLVGERGVTLSGGQNQRVAIARALLKNPRILVLDEATSALDTRSEALVREALDRLQKGRTTLIIAHRLSTIKDADQIAVMVNGQVAEVGRHDDLIVANGHYARLHNLGLVAAEDGNEPLIDQLQPEFEPS
ncbi:MAG: ABC transporter ATP-binding protein [Fimbriimonadaceae bacterium]|nr:ABC transporter ATP-binding protein [Fimbriimonadaceae bacterium]